MAYITKVDLARQAKLLQGETANLQGSLKLGQQLEVNGRVTMNDLGVIGTDKHVVTTDHTGILQSMKVSDISGGGSVGTPNLNVISVPKGDLIYKEGVTPTIQFNNAEYSVNIPSNTLSEIGSFIELDYIVTMETLNNGDEGVTAWLYLDLHQSGVSAEEIFSGTFEADLQSGTQLRTVEKVRIKIIKINTTELRSVTEIITQNTSSQPINTPFRITNKTINTINTNNQITLKFRIDNPGGRISDLDLNISKLSVLVYNYGIGGGSGSGSGSGNYPELRYATNNDPNNYPTIDVNERIPAGWELTPPSGGEYVWITTTVVSPDNILVKPWTEPVRLTGVDGTGINIKGQVPTYADLLLIDPLTLLVNDAYLVEADGKLYIWNGTNFPPEGLGLQFTGESGTNGLGVFKSTAFIRSVSVPSTPTGGTWASPIPTTSGWSDGVPAGTDTLYMSTRIFTTTGESPQESTWTTPRLANDTLEIDFEWCDDDVADPGTPSAPLNGATWSNTATPNTIWMAIRKMVNGVPSGDWEISKIKGEKGDSGSQGQGVFKSSVFTRNTTQPATPTGGSYTNPIPTTSGWSDGVPTGSDPLYMSSRIFTSDGLLPQQAAWTTPTLTSDSADINFEWCDDDVADPGTPSAPLNGATWSNTATPNTIWMAIQKTVNGINTPWEVTRIKGESGEDGLNGNGYEFNYYIANVGDPAPNVNAPTGWITTFPTIANSQTLWMRQRIVYGNGTFSAWSGPFKVTGDDGQSIQGASMAYRGDWNAIKQYRGTQYVVDVVKYLSNDRGYIARTDAGEIPIGTLPTDTNYWIEFTQDVDSIFTDYLFAYSAYIPNLTVGQVSTGVEPDVIPDPTLSGERFTVGFQPSNINDPTTTLSRHGMRLYFPSGRIMMYQGWVDTFDVGDGTTLSNKGVVIWFKDEENSPVDYYIDGGVIIIVEEPDVTRWYHNNLRLINHVAFNGISPTDPDATGAFETAINSAGTPNEVVASFLNGLFHYESLYGSVWINRTTTAWNKVVTGSNPSSTYVTANNSESFVPNGWYFIGTGDMRGIEASGIELDTNTSTGWPTYVDLTLTLKFFYITNGEITNFAYPIANVRMATTSPQAVGTFLSTNKTAQYTEEFLLADD